MKINMKHVWIVFKKELKDAFRDRRALFMNFILPMLTTPLIFLVVIYASKSAFEVKPEKTKICIIGEQYAKQLVDISKSSQLDIVQSSNPKKDLQDGNIKAVIEIPQNGKLLTYTKIHVAPQEFQGMAPYAVGIVQLENGLKIPGMIRGVALEKIKIGMPLTLDFGTCATTKQWPQWPRYYFKPA